MNDIEKSEQFYWILSTGCIVSISILYFSSMVWILVTKSRGQDFQIYSFTPY
jgi:hypothetical protein